ncbi:MAG: Rab family GTPase [Candidatus Thorarchaeota archaeon]
MLDKKSSDFLWKIVLCGDSFVGKTTIRKRAMGEHFAEEYISTVGADFSSYKLRLGDLAIGFQVWDLAGQDKYKYIRSSFYGGATGCFLVFDVTNAKSLKSLSNWVDEAIRYSNGTIEIFIICANKIDIKNRREIPRETIDNFTKALRESSGLQCEYIETSALTGENIDIAFDKMAKCLLEREGITPIKEKELPLPPPEEKEPVKPVINYENLAKPPITPQVVIKREHEPPIQREEKIKTIMLDDNDRIEETEKLIAEVMSVLDETNDVIIGREKTDEGERAITVPKAAMKKQVVDEEPTITPELERVLLTINRKLDSLTTRLKDLEEEITHVKIDNMHEDVEIVHEIKKELPPPETSSIDELDELLIEENIEETMEDDFEDEIIEDDFEPYKEEEVEVDDISISVEDEDEIIADSENKDELDNQLDNDQRVLESLLEFEPLRSTEKITQKEAEERERPEQSRYQNNNDELIEIPNEELMDLPENGSIEPVREEHVPSKDSLIGTELSSAMISELKDLADEIKPTEEKIAVQPLTTGEEKNKTICSICGEPAKYIRQYNKYYCVKCGRYII